MDTTNNIFLQLGDIIQLEAPTNTLLHNNIYIIDYIDSNVIKLIAENTSKRITLDINSNGDLSDESILSISLLNRDTESGYARQHNLITGTWVDIPFGGDLPTTITGIISNLEDDMIEIKTFPENDIVYIDFAYKGIPLDLPITSINIREQPESYKAAILDQGIEEEKSSDIVSDKSVPDDMIDDVIDEELIEEAVIQIPTQDIKAQIKELIIDADQIQFGKQLDSITQTVEVSEQHKRYSIDTQTNDLLDELLSTIPNADRTRNVLNSLHTMIERFTQLRTQFSNFDNNGNANMPTLKGETYKPLVKQISDFNYHLYWILPVAVNRKKLYNVDINEIDNNYPDVVSLNLSDSLNDESDIRDLYKSNTESFNNYMNKLQPYLTPFENPTFTEDVLAFKQVNTNIETIVNNLTELYSSVAKNDNVKRRQFVIQKYNLGLSKLHASEMTSSKMVATSTKMTPNDMLAINSMVTLPEPASRFSNIVLPATNIYDKTNLNLHYFNYWQLLRKNVAVNRTIVDDLNTPIDYDNNKFLDSITEYILEDVLEPGEIASDDRFTKYLDMVIPTTKSLFSIIKHHITGKLSFTRVVKHLQPFLVYKDDVSSELYSTIFKFIQERILLYKREYAANKTTFNKLRTGKYKNSNIEATLYKLMQGVKNIRETVFDAYDINTTSNTENNETVVGNTTSNTVLSGAEIISKMMHIDYTKLYMTGITLLNMDLLTPFDFNALFAEKKELLDKTTEENEKNNECKQYVIAKRYIDLDDLNGDNDIDIYFDTKYDPTVYDIINEYKAQQDEMDDSAFKDFLTEQLTLNVGLKRGDAKYEATSMINKKRAIVDGQYAVLEIDNIDSVQYLYYKRDNNTWVRDENIPDNTFVDNSNLFCNIQQKCIQVDKTCADNNVGADLLKKQLITDMYNEFDNSYQLNKEQLIKNIDERYANDFERMSKLKTINEFQLFKYENRKLRLMKDIEIDEITVSPYAKVRDAILGQSDFIKKQYDIITFITKFTRPSNPIIESENEYWLYCVVTDTPLLPIFLYKLATTFVENGDYLTTLDTICDEQGTISEDKENWVDKHSGYIIKQVSLSSEEGYDTGGFKLQTRELLEMDAGNAILQSSKEKLMKKYDNPIAQKINNVLTSMIGYMSINIDSLRDSIINHVLIALDRTVDDKDEYTAKIANKPKKMPSYTDYYNQSLLFITFAYMVTFIQTSIPSIQSKKTHPGCKRSFVGYPLTGEEDLTSIQYVACIAHKIKSSIEPWKSIEKTKETNIANKIKIFIDAIVLKGGDMKQLLQEKRNYLLQNEDDFIPIEHDIKKWINFLPPLQSITNQSPINITSQFTGLLQDNMKKGSTEQISQINVIRSKIIYFSLAIIQCIQKIVEKEVPLLTNNNQEPFIQNACCNNGEYNTLDYFTKKDPSIKKFNEIVMYLTNVLHDIQNLTRAPILLDAKNTKMQFPTISNDFSEETIYRAFIFFCNYNTDIPVNDDLIKMCLTRPDDYDPNDSIQKQIETLKNSGNTFTLAKLNNLLDIINKQNIVPIKFYNDDVSSIQQSRSFIKFLQENNYSHIDDTFLQFYSEIIDRFDIDVDDDDDETVREFRNYISKRNGELENNIKSFLNKNNGITKNKLDKLMTTIRDIADFHTISNNFFMGEKDETLYKSILFIKNAIHDLLFVFPNIVLNQVDYDDIKIPKHWGLSPWHNGDISKIISKHYHSLKRFYQDATISPLLVKIQSNMTEFYKLAEMTYFFSDIHTLDGKTIHSVLDNKTSKLMFTYYFLYAIHEFILLKDDDSIITREVLPKEDVNDIISSVEVNEEATGLVTELELVRAEKKGIREKIAEIIIHFISIIDNDKQTINLNSKIIKEKTTRAKDKEKDTITTFLRDLSVEEREIENEFKNYRLERWNKGLQKGLTQYVASTYDEERETMEKQLLNERQLGKKDYVSDMNREIYMGDLEESERVNDSIEQEEYNMNNIPDDDDFGDHDDAYMLEND